MAARIVDGLGRGVAWLTLIMTMLIFAVVLLRYGFNLGWIWLQESVTWMHAAVFMLAAAYTLANDDQGSVDCPEHVLRHFDQPRVDAPDTDHRRDRRDEAN